MPTRIKTLEQNGDIILPRTVASAVTMSDGMNLEAAMSNRNTDSIKLTAEVADAVGSVEGATLSSLLINNAGSTANVLASAEVIE